MRPHKYRKKIEKHLSNLGTFQPQEITEISEILSQFPSVKHHELEKELTNEIASEKAKLYLAKALAELEVKEKDGKIIFYESKKSWWSANYPWVLGVLSVIAAIIGAYINYLKIKLP